MHTIFVLGAGYASRQVCPPVERGFAGQALIRSVLIEMPQSLCRLTFITAEEGMGIRPVRGSTKTSPTKDQA
jgi:hypothetical protein